MFTKNNNKANNFVKKRGDYRSNSYYKFTINYKNIAMLLL